MGKKAQLEELQKQLDVLGYHAVPNETVSFDIPYREHYHPLLAAWEIDADFMKIYDSISPYSLVTIDRCYILYRLSRQACRLNGEIWECGVYKGGTAMLLSSVLDSQPHDSSPELRLFDTFGGMPAGDPSKDIHRQGDLSDTSLEAVMARVGTGEHIHFLPGFIPDTFQGLDSSRVAFAHIDVDIHDSVLACCAFLYPRLLPGAFLIFDDYGFPTCPGAKRAVDTFFSDKPEEVLVLQTGQALVIKLP